MANLMSKEKWIEQIDQMIDRLGALERGKCLPDWLDGMAENNIISEYSIDDNVVTYIING